VPLRPLSTFVTGRVVLDGKGNDLTREVTVVKPMECCLAGVNIGVMI